MGEIIYFFGREGGGGRVWTKKLAGSREMQAFWQTLTQSCLLRSHLVTELKQTTTAFRDLCLRVCTYFLCLRVCTYFLARHTRQPLICKSNQNLVSSVAQFWQSHKNCSTVFNDWTLFIYCYIICLMILKQLVGFILRLYQGNTDEKEILLLLAIPHLMSS